MRRTALFVLLLASCASKKEAPRAVPSVRFETPRGPWVVQVEVARTDEERSRGLMFRRDLPPGHGMIFIFDADAEHGFWMRNTLLSLDMIFLGGDRTVVGVVERAEPKTEITRSVGKPSRYVVEVAGGEAAAHAIGPGTRAVFVDVPE